ncbi:MAG TPA: c-type cytochrome [Nitrospiria bacterium]|nr:c-type cytochrome [Nitrospiria bacterium]
MKHLFSGFLLFAMMFVGSQVVLAAEEKDPCASRVPADQLSAAKAEKNPYAGDAEAIAEGKSIFEGKGTCFTCHGMTGGGDGEAGAALDPLPRDFTNAKFQDCKSDGEMVWVIKNGSPGTGMIPAVATGILTEEEAEKVQA